MYPLHIGFYAHISVYYLYDFEIVSLLFSIVDDDERAEAQHTQGAAPGKCTSLLFLYGLYFICVFLLKCLLKL